MCWSRWLWMLDHECKWHVLSLLAFLWKKIKHKINFLFPLYKSELSPSLLQLEKCLLPYSTLSAPVSTSHPISFCHFPILICNLHFSVALHTQTWSNTSFIFSKTKENTWSLLSVYLFISFLLISKPSWTNCWHCVWDSSLPNLSLVFCNPASPSCIYLVKTSLAKISDDHLSWELHNQDIIFLLFNLWASYKADECALGFSVFCMLAWWELFYWSMRALNFTFISPQVKICHTRPAKKQDLRN